MTNEELKIMIPSETVQKYVLETGWTFTDMEKAALLFHNIESMSELDSQLRDLRDRTADDDVRKQITEYLEQEERDIRVFKENGDKRCVCVLKAREEGGYWDGQYLAHGYFFDWETAFECGKKEKVPFQIEKYRVDDETKFKDDGTCSHRPIADLCFAEDGVATNVWSREGPGVENSWRRFTDMYLEVPNPFEAGDIVKSHFGGYGIVDTSQEYWKKRVARHKENQKNDTGACYADIILAVAFLNEEDGTFEFGEGDPFRLERYEAKSNSPMDQLLDCASLVRRGKSYLSNLFYCIEKYKESLEN